MRDSDRRDRGRDRDRSRERDRDAARARSRDRRDSGRDAAKVDQKERAENGHGRAEDRTGDRDANGADAAKPSGDGKLGSSDTGAIVLEVLRDGKEALGKLFVEGLTKRNACVFGRHPHLCDVVMEHASISRQHARLTLDSAGFLLITDLHSGAIAALTFPPHSFITLRFPS